MVKKCSGQRKAQCTDGCVWEKRCKKAGLAALTVKELREEAKYRGISPLPRLEDDLIKALKKGGSSGSPRPPLLNVDEECNGLAVHVMRLALHPRYKRSPLSAPPMHAADLAMMRKLTTPTGLDGIYSVHYVARKYFQKKDPSIYEQLMRMDKDTSYQAAAGRWFMGINARQTPAFWRWLAQHFDHYSALIGKGSKDCFQ